MHLRAAMLLHKAHMFGVLQSALGHWCMHEADKHNLISYLNHQLI